MLYSGIEKSCNSSRSKAPCLHVQPCLPTFHPVSEVELLIIERLKLRFDFNVAANLTKTRGNKVANAIVSLRHEPSLFA